MGVTHESRSENEMAVEIEKHYGAREKPLTIGYFGKLAPSGISKGYEDILDLSLELSKKIKDFKILFIGIGISELQMLMNEIEHRGVDRDKILIQTHLPHSKNLELMKNCHFLVLPANKDPKYFGFPLKALEYVISLRLIIAGDTQINREVFVDEFQPIWYGRNEISKLADLVASCHNLEFLKKYLVSGVKYAEQFTWHRRTTKILASIQDLSGI
jgi:glycosyltransferase involved in cell wall biosynthesis